MSNMNISEKVYINDSGEIMVSDLFGDTNYSGIFDTININTEDYTLNKVFDTLSPYIKIYNFADILKQDICMNLLGLTYKQCYGSDDDKNTMTSLNWENMPGIISDSEFWNFITADNQPKKLIFHKSGIMTAREVMEYIGTGIFRQIMSDVWINGTIKKIQKEKPKLAIIADCRFPNEIQSIKNNNGKILRLTRDPHNSNEPSERALDMLNYNWNNFDYIVDNKDMNIFEQLSTIKDTLSSLFVSC
ncbi:MAG: hypothetical protein EBR82_17060 [Caulobacteraceae bacterium]|nr:hypothetical protein [Caulobacteraceae bacterium]